ncbi:MAG: hypothetical protein ACO3LE_00695, partial [Bdellovibrionota bacterium]
MNRPKKTSLTKPRIKALSLVQTLIGLGLAGLVMVFAFSIGSKLFRPSKLSEAMLSLTNKSLVIKESLKEIFQEAPRINGGTAELFPPIARWNGDGTEVSPNVRGNEELFDSIVVFAHPNAASVPLTVPPIAEALPRWLINIQTQSEEEISNNLGRYFKNSLTATPDQLLYSLTRLNQIDVIQKFVVTESLSSDTGLSYPFDAPTANVNFEDGAYLLRELARYDIFVRNGDLIASQNTQNSRGSRER